MSTNDSSASDGNAKPLIAPDTGRQRLLRLGFLALLVGGLVVWAQLRKPKALPIELDLAAALPGEVREVDLIVRREGRLLARKQLSFDAAGAPQIVRTEVQATEGPGEIEADLVYRDRAATRTHVPVELSAGASARIAAVSP